MPESLTPNSRGRSGCGPACRFNDVRKRPEQQLPGIYRVSVYVNEQRMETRTLEFKEATEAQRKAMGESLVPCLSRTQLAEMGVRVESFPALNLVSAEACVPFDEIIPTASSHFDFSEQKLVLSFLRRRCTSGARHGAGIFMGRRYPCVAAGLQF